MKTEKSYSTPAARWLCRFFDNEQWLIVALVCLAIGGIILVTAVGKPQQKKEKKEVSMIDAAEYNVWFGQRMVTLQTLTPRQSVRDQVEVRKFKMDSPKILITGDLEYTDEKERLCVINRNVWRSLVAEPK